jgi:uncharacterized protein (DUF488 family)
MSSELYTIGHSTHSIDEFLELLTQHGIQLLADIRRFPGSRRLPQFNQTHLAAALLNAGIEYQWIESLGGRRERRVADSVNLGLRNESFRNYADYMATEAFRHGVDELLATAVDKRTAFMCSESVFWRCHRRLVADYLLSRGLTVQHIMPTGKLQPHALTEGAKIENGTLTYPLSRQDQVRTLFE